LLAAAAEGEEEQPLVDHKEPAQEVAEVLEGLFFSITMVFLLLHILFL
jgi:hypothetical protein